MLTKLCPSCGRIIQQGQKRCDACQLKSNANAKQYDKNIRDKRATAFYKSVQWTTIRNMAMARDGYQCQRCKRQGIVRPAEEVHHITPLKKDWSKRIELSNLVSLCHKCHMEVERGGNGEWKKV